MVNIRVESSISFHAEESDDSGKTQTIWKRCLKLAKDDKVGSCNPYIPLNHSLPMHANDICHQYLIGRQTGGMPTP